uniref:Ribosomal protein L32 n=1 Tax=Lotharella vacuolata TaxID=74820 RepID=A0A0H5BL63_9EUKA|nr:ribosomal protein L32 [Lotharella vacuolata]
MMKKAFIRFNSKKLKRVKKNWRKPRGIDSKIRKKNKGFLKIPKIGYGTSKKIVNLNRNGKKTFLINNKIDLALLSCCKHFYNGILQKNISCFNRKFFYKNML